jgi:DDB1- and CUL4-associated factor 15
MLQFTASDFERVKHCQNCSNTSDCLIHRKLYQSSVLFTWNIASGDYEVLDYGKLKLVGNRIRGTSNSAGRSQNQLVKKLNKLTKKLFHSGEARVDLHNDKQYLDHLRILDADENRTKDSLVDLKNCIEFFRRHPYDTPDSVSSLSSTSNSEDSVLSFSSDDDFDENTDDFSKSLLSA